MSNKATPRLMSQCQVIGRPLNRTWKDYRNDCMDTYGGGHRNDGTLETFQHGMNTVFNLLDVEFPSPHEIFQAVNEHAALCAVAEAAEKLDKGLNDEEHFDTFMLRGNLSAALAAHAAVRKS